MPWKLNMGSGRDIRQGYVNADRKPLKGVDVLCDFSRFPWPFRDDAFDEVIAVHVIEHLPDTIRAMEELHRVTRSGARTMIEVPHYKHSNAYKDPTHVRFFTEETFDYFGRDDRSYYTDARFDVASVEKVHEYHIDKYVKRWFPRILPWVERYLDNTVEKLIFTLVTRK
ncbi:MAG: methyltransferase domain-containing protein [Methanobacteriota archaeon]|nr:MAG: methyltransferase domain-containing protein [Euryarchaeota archaeon]